VKTDTNLMRFGPRDNEVVETHELIYSDFPILEYRWTPETVTGSESGRIARVWVWARQQQV